MTRHQFLQAIDERFDEDDLMRYIDENGQRNDVPGFLLLDTVIHVADWTWDSTDSHDDAQELLEEFAANMDLLTGNLSKVGDGDVLRPA